VRKRAIVAILGLGLVGWGLYRIRRQILARLLRLPPARNDVVVARGVRVPMPDGVALVADHYRPRAQGSFPTILIRSPYGRGDEAGPMGWGLVLIVERFAERGYHLLIQDVRGRFDSEGQFETLTYEAADGLATIEWIARQPWSDGAVGMWGPSYLGYCQWAVATAAPASLKAVMPIISFSSGHSASFLDGAPALDTALRALAIFEYTGNRERPAAQARRLLQEQEQILQRAFRHLPLMEADAIVAGKPVRFYRQGLAHPRPGDPVWQAVDQHARLAQVEVPAHLVGGWYDLFLRDVLADYAALKAAGRAPYLTIGPWYHLDLRWVPETIREGLAWFDCHLKGERRRLRERPVRIYVLGADEWRQMDDWPPPAVQTRYFLHARHRLSVNTPASSSPPDRYCYDPADPTPVLGGPLLLPPAGPLDNRPLEARPDVLCYTTAPLARGIEVIGPVRLELYVRSNREHTDFHGRLCDVYPDGRSINVCDGLFRLEPGKGQSRPDSTLRLEVDMWATAYRFRRGHCLRLQVSSGAHPRWARNLGTSEAAGSGTGMAAAEQMILHDEAHPSALVLPVTEWE
jgi:putative CocE/NonD family hydrolase